MLNILIEQIKSIEPNLSPDNFDELLIHYRQANSPYVYGVSGSEQSNVYAHYPFIELMYIPDAQDPQEGYSLATLGYIKQVMHFHGSICN